MKQGINPQQFRQYVIEPVLVHLAQWEPRINSEAAIRLLLMTAAHESRMGHYLHQVKGPAVGIYQMEPATAEDIFAWMTRQPVVDIAIERRPVSLLYRLQGIGFTSETAEMAGNLYYATAMARLHYWRVPEPLPDADDVEGLATYAKRFYNSMLGKAQVADYANAARDWQIV